MARIHTEIAQLGFQIRVVLEFRFVQRRERGKLPSGESRKNIDFFNNTFFQKIGPPHHDPELKDPQLIYYETMVNVAVELGSSEEVAWSELRKVAEFEKELIGVLNNFFFSIFQQNFF